MAGISRKKIKLKNGKEVVKYTITYRDVFGVQHTSGIYDTIKEAKKDLPSFNDKKPDVKNITYGMIFNAFLEKVKTKYAKNTIDNYKRYYELYLKKTDGIRYDKLNSIAWQNHFDGIEKHSPYIAQICLKFAKAAANYSIKHDLIKYNVFNKIEPIKLPKADINHLTIKELKMVLEECKKSYNEYYTLLYTFIGTGAREGEIFALNKEDFNYKDKSIKITKQYTKGELLLHPKTSHSYRYIYIFDDLAELINNHIKTLDKNNPLLFPNNAGNYHNASNFRSRVWHKLLEICNIKKRVRLHDLRGTYIDLTQAKGIPIKFTQNNVGHSRSSTTLDIYNQNSPDMINFAQNILNKTFTKCEHFVSKKENPPNKKIIHFPKRSVDTVF